MMKAHLRCLMLLPLACALPLRAQQAFPRPAAELLYQEGEAAGLQEKKLRLLRERYGAMWQAGKARWQAVEGRFRRAAKGHAAVVEKMEFRPDGSCRISFRAWFRWSDGSMRSESFSVGPPVTLPEGDPPLLSPAGRAFHLEWKDARTPPPFAEGSPVTIGTDAAGEVICSVCTAADIAAVRLDPAGLIEVILRTQQWDGAVPPESPWFGAQPSGKMMHLRPAATNLQLTGRATRFIDVLWEAESGITLVSLNEEAGDDVAESMIGLGARAGVPVANDPGFRFRLGSDGWKSYHDLPYEVGAIGFEYLIPARQFITPRDGFDDMGDDFIHVIGGGGVWVFPDSSARLLTDDDLSPLDQESLWKAKNEIFARRGYIFSTPRGKAYAESLGEAYTPRTGDQAAVSASFNEFEKKNVAAIQRFLK
jgi:hypothetical protein